jgi:hypothetical protein
MNPLFSGLHISIRCPQIEGEGLTCMACGTVDATGHVQVVGGEFDGRCLMLICEYCGSPEDDGAFIKKALIAHAENGSIDISTGGPGENPLQVWHKDHWDLMNHEERK